MEAIVGILYLFFIAVVFLFIPAVTGLKIIQPYEARGVMASIAAIGELLKGKGEGKK